MPALDAHAVEAEEVAYDYGRRRALEGIDFQVGVGEIYGFLGPNGGGKTTLFRLLATLLPPRQGRLAIFGHDLGTEAAAARRLLGVVFQYPSLDPHLTARENLLHHGHLYGLRGRELSQGIDTALERFGLAARRGERAGILSGGQRRRLELAKVLLTRPRLLLLDEPGTGLDPGARRDLWRVLEELRAGGVTVLLTTHFMEEGDRCDRLALLDGGRIVVEGTPEALKDEIGGDVVTLVAEDAAALARDLARQEGMEGVEVAVSGDTLRFERFHAHELVARLAEAFPRRIRSVTVSAPTLEDVFLRHTGRGLWQEAPQRGRAA